MLELTQAGELPWSKLVLWYECWHEDTDFWLNMRSSKLSRRVDGKSYPVNADPSLLMQLKAAVQQTLASSQKLENTTVEGRILGSLGLPIDGGQAAIEDFAHGLLGKLERGEAEWSEHTTCLIRCGEAWIVIERSLLGGVTFRPGHHSDRVRITGDLAKALLDSQRAARRNRHAARAAFQKETRERERLTSLHRLRRDAEALAELAEPGEQLQLLI